MACSTRAISARIRLPLRRRSAVLIQATAGTQLKCTDDLLQQTIVAALVLAIARRRERDAPSLQRHEQTEPPDRVACRFSDRDLTLGDAAELRAIRRTASAAAA